MGLTPPQYGGAKKLIIYKPWCFENNLLCAPCHSSEPTCLPSATSYSSEKPFVQHPRWASLHPSHKIDTRVTRLPKTCGRKSDLEHGHGKVYILPPLIMHYIEDHKMLPWMFAGLTDWLTYLTGWLTNLEVHTHIQYCIKTVSGLMGGGVGGLGHSAFLRDGYNMAVLGNVKVRLALFPVGENPPVGKMLPFPGAILRLRTGKFPHMSPYPPAIRTLFGDSKKNSEEEKKQALDAPGCNIFLNAECISLACRGALTILRKSCSLFYWSVFFVVLGLWDQSGFGPHLLSFLSKTETEGNEKLGLHCSTEKNESK